MIYRVLADGIDILGSEASETLISPTLDTELNSAGEFEFTLPPDHPAYDDVKLMQTLIEIYEDGDLIFIGRPSEINIDWFKQKKVMCEGVLSYMNDTVLRPHDFDGVLISDVFKHVIQQHNSQVDSTRQFTVGNVTITDRYVYTSIDYDNCLSVLKSVCVDTTGGYLFVRKDNQDNLYLDWLAEVPYTNDQAVQFGSNMLDLTQDIRAEDICTVVLPLGAQIDGVNLTIASVNQGSDILEDADAIAVYGRITRVQSWTDIQDAQALKEKAQRWLTEEQYDKLSIEVNAAELHYFDGSVGAYKLGQMVDVISGPHGIDKQYPIIKMSISLDSGTKQVTLGTPPRQELTSLDILTSNASSGYSGSSGGSGGGSSSGIRDVLVNGSSVVSEHVARVSVPTDTVTQGQMNMAIATAVAPKANTSDVNAALSLKANASDVINVVANPSGTATDELEKIQIGNDIYEIVGGGGGGSQKFEETLIFDTPTSSTGNITVSSMSDADELIFIIGIFANNEYQVFSNTISMTELKKGERVFIGGTVTISNGTTYSKYASVKYINDTTIAIIDIGGHSWSETGYLYRIYKRKYASNSIYIPALYSEEEREVGVWTDGKPLYQKSIHFSSPVTVAKYGTPGTTIATIANIEQIVSSTYSTFQNGSSNEEKSLIFWIENNDIKASDMFSHQYYNSQFTDFTFQYTKTTDQPGSGTWTPAGEYAYHYSTSEKVVGTWIDGNTVYEKTFDLGSDITVTNNWTATPASNSGMDKCVKVVSFMNSNGINRGIPQVHLNAGDYINLAFLAGSDSARYLTIQYTKTT